MVRMVAVGVRMVRMMRMVAVSVRMMRMMRMVAVYCRPSATIVAVGAQGTGTPPRSGAAVIAFAIRGPVARV